MNQRVQVLTRLEHNEGENTSASEVDQSLGVVHRVQVLVDEDARVELDVVEECCVRGEISQAKGETEVGKFVAHGVEEEQVEGRNQGVGCVVEPVWVKFACRHWEYQLAPHQVPHGPKGVNHQTAHRVGQSGEHQITWTS